MQIWQLHAVSSGIGLITEMFVSRPNKKLYDTQVIRYYLPTILTRLFIKRPNQRRKPFSIQNMIKS